MMKRYFAALLAFLVAIFVGVQIARDPGYATFYYRHTTVSMPLWLCVLAVIIVFIVFAVLLRLLDSSRYLLQKWSHWRTECRRSRLQKKSERGLLTLLEGRFAIAEKQLHETFRLPNTPIMNYLSAAQAAHEQSAFDRRDAYLNKAARRDPSAAIPIAIAKAQWQLEQNNVTEAAETLGYLKRVAPKHPRVMLLLKALYEKQEAWSALLEYIPFLVRHRVMTQQEAQALYVRAYSEECRQLDNKNSQEMIRFFDSLPRNMRLHPEVVGVYAEQLLLAGNDEEAADTLLRILKKQWDIHLVRLYGLARTANPLHQFKHIEKWLMQHPNDPELLLVAGQLAMRVQLWGKASTFLEHSVSLSPRAVTYQSLGKLYEQLGDQEKALTCYREGIAFTSVVH